MYVGGRERVAKALRYLVQGLSYGAFVVAIGFFSERPAYTYVKPGQAVIKLSMNQYGSPIGKCRKLTSAQLAALPAYQRLPLVCPRRRYPVRVALWLGRRLLYDRTQEPAGLHHDGRSYIFAQFTVPSGRHRIQVSVWDNGIRGEPDRNRAATVNLRSNQIFVITYNSERAVPVLGR